MQIKNFEEEYNLGQIVATFDIYIPALGFCFNNWRLIRSKKGILFPKSPSYSVVDDSGEKKWKECVEILPQWTKKFEEDLMKALEPYICDLKG